MAYTVGPVDPFDPGRVPVRPRKDPAHVADDADSV
jgi:hypothetical protein